MSMRTQRDAKRERLIYQRFVGAIYLRFYRFRERGRAVAGKYVLI